MGLGRLSKTTVAAGLLAALVAGCGSSQGLLSARSHDKLAAQLLAVRQAVSQGNCASTADALTGLDTVIDGLPPQTNATLDRNLRQGAAVVRQNATRQCHHKRPKPPVTTSTSSSTTTTTSTSTAAATSTTAPPTTTSAPPPTSSTQTTPPPTNTTPPSTSSTPAPPSTNTTGGGGLNPGSDGHGGRGDNGGGNG